MLVVRALSVATYGNAWGKMNKLHKYNILRRLPGKLGRRYQRKYTIRCLDRRFEDAIHRSRGKTCIDLGANIGLYTRRMAAMAKQVIAFEPDPWTHSLLQDNIADLDNVRIENAAAGTSEGTVLLYRHARFAENPVYYSQSATVILYDTDFLSEESAAEVRQIDFIAYLEDLDEDIGVLKIDIEGAEMDLLEALFDRPDMLERIDHIFAETHETWIPGLGPRVKALRARASRIDRPCIDLDWR